MSKYTHFEDFMNAVVEEADRKCQIQYQKELVKFYQSSYHLNLSIFRTVIVKVLFLFLMIVVALALGPLTFFVFGSTISCVVTTVGLIALAVCGVRKAIKLLYQNRMLPKAIKEVGESYKRTYQANINDVQYIDNLIDRASDRLLDKLITKLGGTKWR